MNDYEMLIAGLAALIRVQSDAYKLGWTDDACRHQAALYVDGCGGDRIASITFHAITMARMISLIK